MNRGERNWSSGGGQQSEKVLAVQLHEWLTKEMHFYPQGPYMGAPLPTVEQLKKICRGSQQAELWNFVINNVHSLQTVRKVKGNLQLKARSQRHGYAVSYKLQHHYDNKRQSLLSQREKLLGETTALLSETRQVEQELRRLESDIQAADTEYHHDMEEMRDVGRRACLMQLFVHSTNHFTATVDAFSDRVHTKRDALLSTLKGVDKELYYREEGEDVGRMGKEEEGVETGGRRRSLGETQLETSTAREVRACCEHIGKFLTQTLQGNFGSDKSLFQFNKEQLWRQVETTLANHSIELVVNALVRQTQKQAQLLREHTAKVNIQKDAEKLRFKYEKGGVLRDTSSHPTVLQSVQQLLEESQLHHVMRFVETEKHLNAARPHLEHLEATRAKIDALLQQQLSEKPAVAELASQWVKRQLEVEGDRIARDVYLEELAGVRERVHREQTARANVIALHSKIQHFQDLANAKQNLIQVVARQNAGAKSRLTAQHLHLKDYIHRSFPDYPMETEVLMASLKGKVTEEVNKVVGLALPYLLHLHLDSETKVGLLDLSILFTTHPTARGLRQQLHTTLHNLQFPAYKAPECALKHCLALKEEKDQCEQRVRERNSMCSSVQVISGVTTDMDNLSVLCNKVKAIDKEELEKLLPVLQKRLSRAARASTECIKLKDYMQSWWEQPAQFSTPWVTVEEQTYQQWYNRWKILATNIRQLDLQRSSSLLESKGSEGQL